MHITLAAHLDTFLADGRPSTIDDDRAGAFEPLIDWIARRVRAGEAAPVVFVCTHNSRRSQLGMAWARAAALHLGLPSVTTFSGGTEATAFASGAVEALRAHGFGLTDTGERAGEGNIVYALSYGDEAVRAFSKVFSDPFNPQEGFGAVMVCTSADEACPFVPGADVRVAVPYVDPKRSDGTPEAAATYRATSEEIGREMTWMLQSVKARV